MFQGFSPETIDFLWGIRMNNNREWFLEHKQQYVLTLYEPMKELAKEISRPFVNIPGFLCKTSRIYRDMRMHPDTPYKESLWICLRQEGSWWQQEPSLFFELTPDQYSYGFLWWQPAVAMMNGFRQDIVQHSDVFLKMVHKAEKESGMTVSGRSYARRKLCENKSVDPYYQLRNIVAYRDFPISEELFSPELATNVRNSLEALYPLCSYCQKFVKVDIQGTKKPSP